ncbi:hypothetical protein BJ878DRAFT_533244 [Calycina marina]|uniref:Uncharacterized protein n=1 Tax=Calycina marina TaxID=1763456 RepID=A0A9P8CH54_9HELO|nr:hypothetical protein BJ878DRAFT_533244 [Calycina marina]
MATTMVAATRQPFAPINGSRLQNMTSLKNRQNGMLNPLPQHTFLIHLALASPTKRKAAAFDNDDSENVDPILFLSPKKFKTGFTSSSANDVSKPVNYFLTKAPLSPSPNEFANPLKPVTSPLRRPILPARSPAPRLNTTWTSTSKSSPLSAPAGRSPTRKRIGLLNRRRTNSPYTRVDPPKFPLSSSSTSNTSNSLGFSIDAALSGTIPSYKPRTTAIAAAETDLSSIPLLHTSAPRDGWFFEIHEDTEDELATNLMEHSACTLDISSDEESALRERSDRGKENVPPVDDVSQTSTAIAMQLNGGTWVQSLKERFSREDDACDIDRAPLGEMAPKDFWAEGCNEESVVLVPVDSDTIEEEEKLRPEVPKFDFTPQVALPEVIASVTMADVDALMQKSEHNVAPTAALSEGIEKVEENFAIYESGSEKGDA